MLQRNLTCLWPPAGSHRSQGGRGPARVKDGGTEQMLPRNQTMWVQLIRPRISGCVSFFRAAVTHYHTPARFKPQIFPVTVQEYGLLRSECLMRLAPSGGSQGGTMQCPSLRCWWPQQSLAFLCVLWVLTSPPKDQSCDLGPSPKSRKTLTRGHNRLPQQTSYFQVSHHTHNLVKL